jgi:hypothetical protein
MKIILPFSCIAVFAIVSLSFCTKELQADFIRDGGFEQPIANFWGVSGFVGIGADPHSGSQQAYFQGSNTGSLTQSISGLTSGGTYTLSFWEKTYAVGGGGDLRVTWDGNTVDLILPSAADTYFQHSYNVTANGSTDSLLLTDTFSLPQDSSTRSLDDVSLIAAVPEPAALVLGLLGIAVGGCMAWRQSLLSAR